MLSQLLILALMLIAANVAARAGAHESSWNLITAYWVVLTVKNLVALVERNIKH